MGVLQAESQSLSNTALSWDWTVVSEDKVEVWLTTNADPAVLTKQSPDQLDVPKIRNKTLFQYSKSYIRSRCVECVASPIQAILSVTMYLLWLTLANGICFCLGLAGTTKSLCRRCTVLAENSTKPDIFHLTPWCALRKDTHICQVYSRFAVVAIQQAFIPKLLFSDGLKEVNVTIRYM